MFKTNKNENRGRKLLDPVPQMVEHSAWIRRLWVQVQPGVRQFMLQKLFLNNIHSPVDIKTQNYKHTFIHEDKWKLMLNLSHQQHVLNNDYK